MSFRLTPDPDFAERFENDRTFLVSKGSVRLMSGKTQKALINIDRPMSNVPLSQISNRIQSGDRIVVKIEEIVRINYKDQEITIPFFGNSEISIN